MSEYLLSVIYFSVLIKRILTGYEAKLEKKETYLSQNSVYKNNSKTLIRKSPQTKIWWFIMPFDLKGQDNEELIGIHPKS